jgi:Mrp family chromosome partitioning ATPase
VLLEMLRQRFDLILLDLPAVTAEAEAAHFAAQSDGVIIVAQQEGEHRSPVAEARALLAAASANILGVVLNHRGEADGEDVRQVA